MKRTLPQQASDQRQGPGPTDAELCDYIVDICGELRGLTRRPGFRMVSYLLDMARLEAEHMAREQRIADEG